jgi:hypothetical protein
VSIEADRPPNHTPSRAVATDAVNGGLVGLFFVRLSLLLVPEQPDRDARGRSDSWC